MSSKSSGDVVNVQVHLDDGEYLTGTIPTARIPDLSPGMKGGAPLTIQDGSTTHYISMSKITRISVEGTDGEAQQAD